MEPAHSFLHALIAVTLSWYARSHFPFMWFFNPHEAKTEIDMYWTFTTEWTTVTVWFSFFYFFYDLLVEVSELWYHGKRSFADLFHAMMCSFVYGIGALFNLAHVPLVMLSMMECSTIFYNLHLFSRKWYKQTFGTPKRYVYGLSLFFGILFALSFTWVRIVMYGKWYVHVIPYFFLHAQHKHIPCSQFMDGSIWCVPLNQIALGLLTCYLVLNLWWWRLILQKVCCPRPSSSSF